MRGVRPRPSVLRLRRPEPPESAILAAVLALLRVHPAVAWAARFNTGAYVAREGPRERYVRYGFPGCPDVLGQLKTGRLLAIECKRPSGRLSGDQQAFLERAAQYGAAAGVARSVEDAVRIVEGVQ